MKIELLKQRFMHLGLLTCLVLGVASTSGARAGLIDRMIDDAVIQLDNQGNEHSRTYAQQLRAAKQRLLDLFAKVKASLKTPEYAEHIRALRKEFNDFRAMSDRAQQENPECVNIVMGFKTVEPRIHELITVLENLVKCPGSQRQMMAFSRLMPYQDLA